ncbi:MAG: sulfate transporter family protein [Rhizobiales bacterium]|nr:sulfate transporter family protein [Hyphomicrobiales bacterium]
MLLSAASRAFSQLFARELRGVFWKALGLTIALLIALVTLLQSIGNSFIDVSSPWLSTGIAFLTGFGLIIGAGFLLAPAMSVFAGLFLDEVAEAIEARDYPHDRPGVPMPFGKSLKLSLRFLLLVVGVNILALFLLLVPGINLMVFFVANGYLLGREYFQFVAMRFYTERDAKALRSQYSGTIMLAGLLIAGVLAIPIVNLLTPLFATAFMVHLFKGLERKAHARS